MNNLLQNISWAQYLLYVGGAAILYYAIVILLYFRNGISKRIRNLFNRNISQEAFSDERPEGELIIDLETIVGEIGHSILVPGNRASKDELLVQLKTSLANFGGLSRPGYRYALNNYIIQTAKENCGVGFSEEELEAAWQGLPR